MICKTILTLPSVAKFYNWILMTFSKLIDLVKRINYLLKIINESSPVGWGVGGGVVLLWFFKHIFGPHLPVKVVDGDSTLKTTVDVNWRSFNIFRYFSLFVFFSSENVWIDRMLLLWRHAYWTWSVRVCNWNRPDSLDDVMQCSDGSLGEWPSLPSDMSN